MKLDKLLEAKSTNDIPQLGVDMSQYGERQLLGIHNGKNIHVRVNNSDQNIWILDIDEVSFINGAVADKFKGSIKHKLFITIRGWTAESHRGQGLITTMMSFMFMDQDYALMCDDIISPSGRATWLKLCSTLHVTHCYQVDRTHNQVLPIDKQQMIANFNNSDDSVQYIIEDNYDYNQMIGGILPASVFKIPILCEKYDFTGLL